MYINNLLLKLDDSNLMPRPLLFIYINYLPLQLNDSNLYADDAVLCHSDNRKQIKGKSGEKEISNMLLTGYKSTSK